MGMLEILSNIRDVFEVGRKTTTDKKTNKPEKRKYDFEDGEKMPSSKREYNEAVKNIKKTNKVNTKQDDEREL